MSDALAEAVAQAEAELEREVWIAVRITNHGNVAFMGAFDTKENAIGRCEFGKEAEHWKWGRRSDKVQEWDTQWMPWTGDTTVKFAVALRKVQDHPLPTPLRDRSIP